jgi:hypothetical protein
MVGVQSAAFEIVDQWLIDYRKLRRRRQIDIGRFRPQGVGLAANSQQLLSRCVPWPHLVVGDGPSIRHGGVAGVAEILPGSEIAREESLADHAVDSR